jgi:ankyrin repeat protein
MKVVAAEEPAMVAAVDAIQAGDVGRLTRLLAENPGLAMARLNAKGSRTLLHVVTDWPGLLPNGAASVSALAAAGADVNARAGGINSETPLQWAASSDDVEVLDALLDAGADIEADGAVIGGGTALNDATAFAQWKAARRLVERGAITGLFDEAALGLLDRIEQRFAASPIGREAINDALWGACHGGQQRCAEFLLSHGAEINAVPGWEPLTPLDAAEREGAGELVAWLRDRGAASASAK